MRIVVASFKRNHAPVELDMWSAAGAVRGVWKRAVNGKVPAASPPAGRTHSPARLAHHTAYDSPSLSANSARLVLVREATPPPARSSCSSAAPFPISAAP